MSRSHLCHWLLLLGLSGAGWAHPGADLALKGGAVYCLDDSRSWAEAVAVREGRIVYVGSDQGLEPWVDSRTRVIPLQGRLVLPGFCDAHVHPLLAGLEAMRCPLSELKSASEVLARVADYAHDHPELTWIVGTGWGLHLWPQGNPQRQQLDAALPDRPVALESLDGHSFWLNSKALQLCGITSATPDPEGGRIERDAQGNPSGTLREKAMALSQRHLPAIPVSERKQALRWGLKQLNQVGITSFHEANAGPEDLQAYAELEKSGELTARVTVAQTIDSVENLQLRRQLYSGRLVHPDAVKLFLDGVIEARTAALLEPYTDSSSRGELLYPPEVLNPLVERLAGAGFQVHMHAIGDRAVRAGLDSFARLKVGDLRHTIAHLQLVDSVDRGRFAALGVVANVQAFWCQADESVQEFSNPLLGSPRDDQQYPLRALFAAGATVAGGSDWSVTTPDPIQAIAVAVTRQPPGSQEPAWIPSQRVTLDQMLAAYTRNGAFLNHCERDRGTIEAGKFADLVVLDRNLFQLAPEQIYQTRVDLTLFEGRVLYEATDE